MANVFLDVFEESLREAKSNGINNSGNVDGSAEESKLAACQAVESAEDG
jgi:hypothetical protein